MLLSALTGGSEGGGVKKITSYMLVTTSLSYTNLTTTYGYSTSKVILTTVVSGSANAIWIGTFPDAYAVDDIDKSILLMQGVEAGATDLVAQAVIETTTTFRLSRAGLGNWFGMNLIEYY